MNMGMQYGMKGGEQGSKDYYTKEGASAGGNFLWDYLWNKDAGMSDSDAAEYAAWGTASSYTGGLSHFARAAKYNDREEGDPKRYTWRDATREYSKGLAKRSAESYGKEDANAAYVVMGQGGNIARGKDQNYAPNEKTGYVAGEGRDRSKKSEYQLLRNSREGNKVSGGGVTDYEDQGDTGQFGEGLYYSLKVK